MNLNDGMVSSGGEAEGDTLFNIEHATGSAHDDTIIANADANQIDGGAHSRSAIRCLMFHLRPG